LPFEEISSNKRCEIPFEGYNQKLEIMTNGHENKLSMYSVTTEVLDANSAIVGTLPALVTAKSAWVNKTLEIRQANLEQLKSTKGKTMDKGARKLQLAETGYAIAASVQAYAAENENNDLYELVNFSLSKLKKAEDEVLEQNCRLIHGKANALVLDLLDYGVTAAKLTTFLGLIGAWATQSQVPRGAIAGRKVATESIPVLFRASDAILKKRMDKLMANFKVSEPTFYATYFAARKIVDAGHGPGLGNKAKVSGYVKDAVTGVGLVGVKMTLSNAEGSVEVLTGTGGFYVMEVELSQVTTANLSTELTGYLPIIRPLTLEPGKSQPQDFMLTEGMVP
jgi:hypothetical protein